MTKEETVSFLKAYLDGDTSIGNIIPLRKVLQSAVEHLSVQLPVGMDEAAIDAAQLDMQDRQIMEATNDERLQYSRIFRRGFKAGAEWTAGQGVTKEAVIGMATEEISINVSQEALDNLDVFPGDKVIVQIRKK